MKKVMFVALIEDVYNQEMYTEYIKIQTLRESSTKSNAFFIEND